MKIITETEHNGDLHCIDKDGKQCVHMRRYPFRCTHYAFRANGGYERALRTKQGRPKRCRQCIKAAIEAMVSDE